MSWAGEPPRAPEYSLRRVEDQGARFQAETGAAQLGGERAFEGELAVDALDAQGPGAAGAFAAQGGYGGAQGRVVERAEGAQAAAAAFDVEDRDAGDQHDARAGGATRSGAFAFAAGARVRARPGEEGPV